MAEFDVRKPAKSDITRILFGDIHDDAGYGSWIDSVADGEVYINAVEGRSEINICISSAEHAQNLIKALSKAIELGWLK